MKAVLEVTSVTNQWTPPFKKEKNVETITVEEGTLFDRIEQFQDKDEYVFKVERISPSEVLIGYSNYYIPKSYLAPRSRQFPLSKNQEITLSCSWTSTGVTKNLKLIEIVP